MPPGPPIRKKPEVPRRHAVDTRRRYGARAAPERGATGDACMSLSLTPSRLALAGVLLLTLACALLGLRWHAAPATAEDTSGRDILLGLADQSVRDRRLVAPAGRNAYEFYLSVLELEPDAAATHEALRRLFPDATGAVERTIDGGELDEAERELRLLREFDSGNYILALLAG